MRLFFLVSSLLLAFIRCTNANASATSVAALVPDRTGGSTTSDTGTSVKRFLLRGVNDGGGGERTAGNLLLASVPKAEKLKTIFKSSNISPQKLDQWVIKGKSVDIVFVRMGLIRTGERLFYNSKFIRWLNYVDDLNAKNPAKGKSAVSTLTKQYGDTELYNMIKFAKQGRYPEAKTAAARLQREQLQHWLASGQQPDDVFHFMNLNVPRYKFLQDPELAIWVKYVDDFNAKFPKHPASMAASLTKYDNGGFLFNAAEEAKSVPGSKSVAIKIQDDLEAFWLNHRETPDDMVDELGLGDLVVRYYDTLLENSRFHSWAKYLKAFNTKYPHQKTTIIETLTRKYGDSDVAWMIAVAKAKGSTRDLAINLETAQLEMWLSSGKSVDDVLKLLKLGPTVDFGSNPLFTTLVYYIDDLLKTRPDLAASVLSTLKTHFTGQSLDHILQVAETFPSMRSWIIHTT